MNQRMTRPLVILVCMSGLLGLTMLAPLSSSAPRVTPLWLAADSPYLSLDGHLAHYIDDTNRLTFDEVSAPDFVQSSFKPRSTGYSLGYDTSAQWFQARLNPAPDAPARWVLAIGSPELEAVDVWTQQPDGSYRHDAMGYHRPYQDRPLRTRFFALPIQVFADMQLFIRVQSSNALHVHANLWQVDAFTAFQTQDNFFRGGYFGILLIAIAFYCVIGLRLADGVMLAYAGVIAAQCLFHLGTNGYLPVLAGSYAAWMSDALPRIGWLAAPICLALIWDRLLQLPKTHPRLHRLFMFSILFNLGFLPFALMPSLVQEWLLYLVKLANLLNLGVFFISMTLLFKAWLEHRRTEFMLYFAAFVIPVFGVTVNTALNFGLLPGSFLLTNFYQAVVLVHVLVMSYGLALRLRQLALDKNTAEQQATLMAQQAEEQRRFVAMLSHEFGNPLAAIDRAAQMVQIKLPDIPPAEQLRLEQIRSNAATLSGFVSSFLMLESMEHGTMALTRTPCSIHSLLDKLAQQYNEAARQRIEISITPNTAQFSLDPMMMQVAIGNLVSNALRYSPKEHPVRIEARIDAAGLRIRVKDQGNGMSEEDISQLGLPYFRASSSLGKRGSGLGYHFTYRIIAAHGGQIEASSPVGEGLTVAILLPFAKG